MRNRVRHELLPLCADVAGRDPVPLLARQAGVLRDEAALLDSLAAEALPDPADARALARARRPLARRAAAALAARARPGGEHPPSLAEVDRVLAVAAGPRSGPSSPADGGCAGAGGACGWSRRAPVVSRR